MWVCAVYICFLQDQVDKGIMFTEADRVELHNAVTTEMVDLAGKASKGYALTLLLVQCVSVDNNPVSISRKKGYADGVQDTENYHRDGYGLLL